MKVFLLIATFAQAQTYYKCSATTRTCSPINFESSLIRFRRALFGQRDDDEHLCNMKCVCDPEVGSNIEQGSAVKQKGKQEQKVSVPQAFGIGSVILVLGVLVALGLCFYTIRSKLSCCMKCRQCLKFESMFDAELAADADEKKQEGKELSSKERRALLKSDKLNGEAAKLVEKKQPNIMNSVLDAPPAYEDIEDDTPTNRTFSRANQNVNGPQNGLPSRMRRSKSNGTIRSVEARNFRDNAASKMSNETLLWEK